MVDTAGKQKELWNKLAANNSRYYICTNYGKKISEEQFRRSGLSDYRELIAKDKLIQQGGVIAEVGCGIGRMTDFMAEDFAMVYAFDISGLMIDQAKDRLKRHKNIYWFETDGDTLPVKDESVDLVFSYLVFQHVKDKEVVERNLNEAGRILKPDGVIKVLLRNVDDRHMHLWWGGVHFTDDEIENMVSGVGLQILASEPMFGGRKWLWLKKVERLQGRLGLANYFARLKFTKGAEIGVADGSYSEMLCRSIPGLSLLGVDPWERCPDSYLVAKTKLSKYKTTLVKKTSMEAAKDVPDDSLDFVYIDGNHRYQNVKEDIREWSKKVRPGGIVAGHDYYHFRGGGVIQAVDEYTRENNIRFNLTLPTDIFDDSKPSWWWVKTVGYAGVYKASGKQIIHVYCIVKNEEDLMPYFLRHYSNFADKIFIVDDSSIDRTVEILKANDKVQFLTYNFTPDTVVEEEHTGCFEELYKKHSRGLADWVMVVDADEFMYSVDILEVLAEQRIRGHKAIQAIGYNMHSNVWPTTTGQIYEECRLGVRSRLFDKVQIFDPAIDVKFGNGRHKTQLPRGVTAIRPGILLLHYRYLSAVSSVMRLCRAKNVIEKRLIRNIRIALDRYEQGTAAIRNGNLVRVI